MEISPSKELLSEVFGKEVTWSMVLDEDIDTHNTFKLHFQFKNVYYGGISGIEDEQINIYELAFRTREYLKTKSKHLSLNQSIDDIFKEANDIYESLSK